MKTKLQLLFSLSFLLLLLVSACNEGTCQILKYDINQAESAYVILQLEEENKNQDSVQHALEIKSIVDQIRSINSKLGYDLPAKKFASFELENNGINTTYLVIRNFDDFESAESYAKSIDQELDRKIYREIGKPFPISLSNYRKCVEEKDFNSYYKFYISTRP